MYLQVENRSVDQYGFKTVFSTATAIDKLVSQIKNNKNKFKYNVFLAIDISGAFDGIHWSKIIDNLMKSGIDRSQRYSYFPAPNW